MSRKLRLAPDLELPLDLITRRTAIVGQTDTGKTSTAVVVVEEAAAAGAQIVVLDPSGAWWGVTSTADGKGAGLDMLVMGGEHGDVPLNEQAGRACARLVAEQGYSVVLDLDRPYFSSWASRQRFVADFLSELYEVARSQVLVVMDECHRFAPQAVRDESGDAARCLGAVVDVVALGRRRGLAVIAITQRLAKLHKDVLELCEVMVAHRLRGNNDRKALQGWLEEAGEDVKIVMSEVARLERGVARVSAPTLGVEGTFRIREKQTFDSSRTIGAGEAMQEPATRGQVDLEEIRGLMAETIEQAEADDPKRLREEIRRLRGRLEGGGTVTDGLADRVRELEADLEAKRQRIAAADRQTGALTGRLRLLRANVSVLVGEAPHFADHARRLGELEHYLEIVSRPGAGSEPPSAHTDGAEAATGAGAGQGSGPDADHRGKAFDRSDARARRETERVVGSSNGDGPALKAGHFRIMAALDRYYERGLSRAELVPLAAFQSKRTVGDYIAHLKGIGYVDEDPGGMLSLTEAGGEATLDEPGAGPLTRDEVYARQGGKLKAGHRRMLEALFKAYPDGFTRPELAGLVQMNKRTAGDYVAHLKKHGLVDERGRRIYAGYIFYLADAAEVTA